MYSPNAGIFLRRATKDHFIGNIPIKKGMAVNIKIKTMHYRETVYPQPMKFDPERWEKIDMNKMEPFTYLPFSSGQRNCIGQHLSFIEGKVALILILQRYKRIEL
jgi:cytochrome P450